MKAWTRTLALASTIAAAGCGGGGGGSPMVRPDDPEANLVRTEIERGNAIVQRTDSLLVSNITYVGNRNGVPVASETEPVNCEGTRCTAILLGIPSTVSLADFESSDPDDVEVGSTRNGITLLREIEGDISRQEVDATFTYGAWMNHAGFDAGGFIVADFAREITVVGVLGTAGGDRTHSSPDTRMSWSGAMTGAQIRVPNDIVLLEGDAHLAFTPGTGGGGAIDAAFTNLRTHTGVPYATALPGFRSVPVTPQGSYGTGVADNRIQGAFYGPGHAETAGIFEQSGIVGAYGARRD